MKMEKIIITIIYGGTASLLLSVIILLSLYFNPRIWMQDLPKKVQAEIPPKSKKEKNQTIFVLILFLAVFLFLPTMAVVRSAVVSEVPITLLDAFIISYCVLFFFNLTDLLIIDWLIVCTITPNFIRLKGIDESVYKNYSKHLTDFLKGTIIISVPAFVSGMVGYVLVEYGFL